MRIMAIFLVAAAARGAEKRGYKLPRPEETNVTDEARFSLAEDLAARGEFRRAVGTLEEVASRSPDEHARSAAHLGLARLWDELEEKERAEEALARVGGKLAARAVRELILRDVRDGEFAGAAEKLLSFLERARDPFARAAAARKLIELVRGKGLDGGVLLARLCELLPYGEAEALAKAERELKAERINYAGKLKEKVAWLRKQGLWEEAKKLAEKFRPAKAKKTPKGLLEKVKRLEAEGRFEEARKLKEKLGKLGGHKPDEEFAKPEPRPEDEF